MNPVGFRFVSQVFFTRSLYEFTWLEPRLPVTRRFSASIESTLLAAVTRHDAHQKEAARDVDKSVR
jgi:hypothetical protein